MSHESFGILPSRPPVPVVDLYAERGTQMEDGARRRLRGALKRQPVLIEALKDRGFALDGSLLQVGIDEDALERLPIEQMVGRLKQWYGEDLAKQALEVPKATEEELREVEFHGFSQAQEASRFHLERYIEDVLPAAWGESLRTVKMQASLPHHLTRLLPQHGKGEWQVVTETKEGGVDLFVSEALSESELRRFCLGALPQVLALQAISHVHGEQDPKARLTDFYVVSEAVEWGYASDLMPGMLAIPKTPEAHLRAARAYEANLMNLAWKVGSGTQWSKSLYQHLVEDMGLDSEHASIHTSIAKQLLPVHVGGSVSAALARSEQWSRQWEHEALEREIERVIKDIPEPSLRLQLQDACLHRGSGSRVEQDGQDWHLTPGLTAIEVPMLENWRALVVGLHLNLQYQRPLGEGLQNRLAELQQVWRRSFQKTLSALSLAEARRITSTIFS